MVRNPYYPPTYDGIKFEYWKMRMEAFIRIDLDVWMVMVKGYKGSTSDNGTPIKRRK